MILHPGQRPDQSFYDLPHCRAAMTMKPSAPIPRRPEVDVLILLPASRKEGAYGLQYHIECFIQQDQARKRSNE
jgi:hypothetical protein